MEIKAASLKIMLEAALAHASHDNTRPHICGVLLEATEGKLAAIATNGHALGWFRIPVAGVLAESLLSRADCESATSLIRSCLKSNKHAELDVRRDGGKVTFSAGALSASYPVAEGIFPPYQKVIPRWATEPTCTESTHVRLDGVYLASAFKHCALVTGHSDHGYAELRWGPTNRDPVVVVGYGPEGEAHVTIMPLRP